MMVNRLEQLPAGISHDDRFSAATFWFFSGGILGLVTTLINVMIDGGVYIVVQRIVGREACVEGWNPPELYTMFGLAIVSTFAFGFWLWHIRSSVGRNSETDDPEWSGYQRRWFTIGIFSSFCLWAPAKWLFILALANCYGS